MSNSLSIIIDSSILATTIIYNIYTIPYNYDKFPWLFQLVRHTLYIRTILYSLPKKNNNYYYIYTRLIAGLEVSSNWSYVYIALFVFLLGIVEINLEMFILRCFITIIHIFIFIKWLYPARFFLRLRHFQMA